MIRTLFLSAKRPTKKELSLVFHSFKKNEWILFLVLALTLLVSTILILGKISDRFMVQVPADGGTITEGVIGTPRFVNPVLALTDVDRDITSLVYSGLMRRKADGSMIPDLAESYEVSKNGLIYTFVLKDGITFHDGTPLTADDVIFTITTAQDATLKSPRKTNWEGVTVQKIDDRTVTFTLKRPYALFLGNATIGILPSHLWRDIPVEQFAFSDLNMNAIGSGPYEIDSLEKKSSGVPASYTLTPFKKFALGKAHIRKIVIKFYPNEQALIRALDNGDIKQIAALGGEATSTLEADGYEVRTAILPRVFGLFFNANKNKIFADKKVTEALDMAVDKERIITEVLSGYGIPIDSPLPIKAESVYNPEKAQELLIKAGWVRNTETNTFEKKNGKEVTRLSFSIATSDTPELKKAAEIITENLRTIGVQVELRVYDIGMLNQEIIRTRSYEALFFGQIVGNEPNLFAFWHSSQRNDPGLNVGLYTNAKGDAILEDTVSLIDHDKRKAKYQEFVSLWKIDRPAVFVYAPLFTYIVDERNQELPLSEINIASDRFLDVYTWYVESERIWKIFYNKQ